VNSTFVGNIVQSSLGGAMSIQDATALTLQNLTIARNSAPCEVCFAAGIAKRQRRYTDAAQSDLPGQHRRQCLQSMGDVASGSARSRQPAMAADATGLQSTGSCRRARHALCEREPGRSSRQRRSERDDGDRAR